MTPSTVRPASEAAVTSGVPGVRGVADRRFSCAVRSFAAMFPGPRFGGGALSVYLHGKPVVDVWTGWADRAGEVPWTVDTAPMVFSATKGMAATALHRLADRGLIDYDAPVAEYWPEFGVNGKAGITVRDVLAHRAGLSHLGELRKADLLDHLLMEERIAAAPVGRHFGKQAYHAISYGWLASGLARAVTGKGMRELVRSELAEPLNTDGLHLGRPPAGAPTSTAEIIGPQGDTPNKMFDFAARKFAAAPFSALFGALYFPGMRSVVQGDTPLLDTDLPAGNGVATARGLARMYGAIANGGAIDGRQFLSRELVAGLTGRRDLRPDRNALFPLAFHLGYHALPLPGVLPGFGHVGLGGSAGWADPRSGLAFAFVHNRLLTPFLAADQSGFVAMAALIRAAAALAGSRALEAVPTLGSPFVSQRRTVANTGTV